VPEGEDLPKDPGSLWNQIHDECMRQGASIDDYRICCHRTHLNGLPIQRTPMVPEFAGGQLVGDVHQNLTPGEQLVNYIVDVHPRNCAPATYVVEFLSRRSGKTIRRSTPLPLEQYSDIVRKRDEMSRMRGSANAYAPHPQYPASPQYNPMLGAVPQAAAAGMDPLTKHLIDTMLGQLNETRAELAHLRGQPAPPPVTLPNAAAPPAAVDADEAFMRKLKMMREMSALLNPPAPAVTAETIAAAVRVQIVQMLDAGLIAKPGAAVAATAPPPDSIEAILDAKEKEERLKVKLRRAFPGEFMSKEEAEAAKNVENAPVAAHVVPGSNFLGEPLKWLPFPTGDEGMTWREWGARLVAENPKRSGDLISKVMQALAGNEGLLAKAVEAIKGAVAGPVVEAPAAAAATASGGWAPQI
jgi:hypothetical protein